MYTSKDKDRLTERKKAAKMLQESAKLLREHGEAKLTPKQGQLSVDGKRTIISSIVLYAFACEIGLKTLIYKGNNIVEKTHNLEELFNKLPEDVRINIQSRVTSSMTGDEGARTFESLLNIDKDVFEVWRYFFEYKGIRADIEFLEKLSKAINHELDT